MFLTRLIEDKFCKGRFIGYFKNALQIFYKHELRSLAELFGFTKGRFNLSVVMQYEIQSVSDALCLEMLNLPPPQALSLFWESGKSYRLARTFALSAAAIVFMSSVAQALPTGYQSVSGNVHFSQSGSTLNISTQAQRSIASYQSFNIQQGETVNIHLPGANSAILNRVYGQSPTTILGALRSNGQVFLINPDGILFGSSAQVNVGSLVASTLSLSDQNFLSDNTYSFQQDPTVSPASVVNEGNITIKRGGFSTFIAASIRNDGTINAPGGTIEMAVGNKVSMAVDQNLAVDVTVDDALQSKVAGVDDAIANTGTLSASGGKVIAQTNLQQMLYDRSINNAGIVTAKGFGNQAGQIVFSDTPGSGAKLLNTGTINADGTSQSPMAAR